MSLAQKLPKDCPLQFNILKKCSVTKARTSLMKLPHYEIELPMFMPVGTQGTMKGLLPKQVMNEGAQIILGNTYHLGMRPGKEVMGVYHGLHNFMQWNRGLLTDSGGFQMVSLLKLAEITEEGVKFESPFDGSESLLTPEESMEIQNGIGADIIMQLDDVVDVKNNDYERFKTAVGRTTRWLDRCIKANKNPDKQSLFPIIQGGLFPELRKLSLEQLIARDAPGYAIGGLSGGEDKSKFWPTVDLCTDHLPENKPRYCMGVGFAVDLVVCCALGVDMFDCVYPTRTARFGSALVEGGVLQLNRTRYRLDFRPIDENCSCFTCKNYTRSYLSTIATKETIGCHLLSIHNIAYLMRLMKGIRESIKEGRFPDFVREFMRSYFKDEEYPQWVIEALHKVNLTLEKKSEKTLPSEKDAIWDETSSEDMKSDFERTHYDIGYKDKIFEDYTESYEEGRQDGFKTIMDPSSLRGRSYRSLSQWEGVLLGLHSTRIKDLKEDEIKQILNLISRIRKFRGEMTPESVFVSFENATKDIISDCQALCDTFKWHVPTTLLTE